MRRHQQWYIITNIVKGFRLIRIIAATIFSKLWYRHLFIAQNIGKDIKAVVNPRISHRV